MGSLTYQQILAIALASGVKLGGGSWGKAAGYGIGGYFVMTYLNFPSAQCAPPAAQSLLSQFSTFIQSITGRQPSSPPTTVAATQGATSTQGAIDVPYTQVPTPGSAG